MKYEPDLLLQLLDNVSAHICVIDSEGVIVYCNAAWQQFGQNQGSTISNWIGENYFKACETAISSGDTSSNLAYLGIKKVVERKEVIFRYEYPCATATEKQWFLMTAQPLPVDNNNLTYISHQQFHAENELRQYQERLALATQAAEFGIWDLNLQTNALTWDEQMYRIYGVSPAEVNDVYTTWLAHIHPEELSQVKEQFLDFVANKKSFDTEYRITKPDKSIRYVSNRANLIRDENSNPVRVIGISTDITESVYRDNQIQELAYFDYLTGLPNRNKLIASFDLHNQSKGSNDENSTGQQFICICVLDIKGFRAINDALGHQFGDKVLLKLAELLNRGKEASNQFYRVGADEFVITQYDLSQEQAFNRVHSLFSDIQKQLNEEFSISLNAGAAVLLAEALSFSTAMRKCDFALNESRHIDNNKITLYNDSINQKYSRELEIKNALATAVDNDELYLVFQPQYFESLGIIGAEVLVRWHHPKMGNISPAEFIPIAEETGHIMPIGAWVFERTCQLIRGWHDKKQLEQLVISINISPRQLYSADFYDLAKQTLNENKIPTNQIKLEVTEGVFVDNTELAIEIMRKFKRLGIKFSLDDFGTGYSSLSYIKNLPLDIIKIDKVFIDHIASESKDIAVVRSTVSLARGLGVSIIAEGVENQEQHDQLKSIGCFGYQGYFFGKPCLEKEFIQLILEQKS